MIVVHSISHCIPENVSLMLSSVVPWYLHCVAMHIFADFCLFLLLGYVDQGGGGAGFRTSPTPNPPDHLTFLDLTLGNFRFWLETWVPKARKFFCGGLVAGRK